MRFLKHRRTAVTALLILFSTIALGSWAGGKNRGEANVYKDLQTFAKVVERIKSYYVEEVDTHTLLTEAIQNMLQELDPHSQFLTGLDYEDLMLSTRGKFGGLGIFISFRDNFPTVISPIDGTPASRAGLQTGDQIVEIEGQPSEGWQVQKAVRYLRGDPGTNVRFKISRPGLEEPIEYNLVREEIKVSSVSYHGMFDGVGYVKLSSFSRNSRDELVNALKDLEANDMKGLVLDLRYNPGGLLQAATGVAELFLEKDKLVVYTKGRYAQNNHKYYASRSDKFGGYPIVVMINRASASASEIVAGALQDWDAGFVVGEPSFGKGTVQTVFSLSDSQAVKLTTAKYYTPSGRSIHKDTHKRSPALAALPDKKSGGEVAAARDGKDGGDATAALPDIDRPVFHTASGRVVYGGGGITPDLMLEPQELSELERRLERDGLFFSFAIDYSTHHEIDENFEVTDETLSNFKAMLADRAFEYDEADFNGEALDYIKTALTREIVSKNFGRDAMYRVLLTKDKEFQSVLALFHDAPTLQAMFKYAEAKQSTKKASLQ